jgi:putative ABC transport system ATP-binding protein
VTLAIEAHRLSKQFVVDGKPVVALTDLDVSVAPGERLAIVGRSGAGKSTLLNLIGALDRDYTGNLRVLGQDLRQLDDRQLARFRNRSIGFVFQSFHLLPGLDVGRNVLLPAAFAGDLDHPALERRAQALLEELGLADRFRQAPQQLSGGERQRVALARALLLEPPLLICDEPTGSLDTDTAGHLLDLLLRMQQRTAATLVVVTHDPTVAARCDRVLTLAGGRLS